MMSIELNPSLQRGFARACWVLLILAAGTAAATFLDYGITWDEGVQSTYGELVLDYLGSGGTDRRCNDYHDLRYYGAAFESALAAVYRGVGRWKYEIRHAGIGVTALLTLIAVWRFGRLLDSPAVSYYSLLALLMMPRFVGHAFNNSKDIPFACAFAWGMVGLARLLLRRTWCWKDVLLCGAGIGIALSVRVGAILLFGFLAAGVLLSVLVLPEEGRSWRSWGGRRLLKVPALVALSWLIMVSVWPWAHQAPLTRPFLALREMADFSQSYLTLFAGSLRSSDELPRYYLAQYLGITTPLLLLGLAALGLGLAVLRQKRDPRSSRTVSLALLQLWLGFPLVYFLFARPNVYDGVRHFLFVLPAVALFCGIAGDWLVARVKAERQRLAAAALTVLMALSLKDLVLLHPYQSSFFNSTVGGLSSAWQRYEVDYWASSYREAMQWIRREARKDPGRQTVVVVACNRRTRPCAEYYLVGGAGSPSNGRPTISMSCVWDGNEPLPPVVHYYVGMQRYGKTVVFFPDWPVVHRVGRQGATFSVIKQNPRKGSSLDIGQ